MSQSLCPQHPKETSGRCLSCYLNLENERNLLRDALREFARAYEEDVNRDQGRLSDAHLEALELIGDL